MLMLQGSTIHSISTASVPGNSLSTGGGASSLTKPVGGQSTTSSTNQGLALSTHLFQLFGISTSNVVPDSKYSSTRSSSHDVSTPDKDSTSGSSSTRPTMPSTATSVSTAGGRLAPIVTTFSPRADTQVQVFPNMHSPPTSAATTSQHYEVFSSLSELLASAGITGQMANQTLHMVDPDSHAPGAFDASIKSTATHGLDSSSAHSAGLSQGCSIPLSALERLVGQAVGTNTTSADASRTKEGQPSPKVDYLNTFGLIPGWETEEEGYEENAEIAFLLNAVRSSRLSGYNAIPSTTATSASTPVENQSHGGSHTRPILSSRHISPSPLSSLGSSSQPGAHALFDDYDSFVETGILTAYKARLQAHVTANQVLSLPSASLSSAATSTNSSLTSGLPTMPTPLSPTNSPQGNASSAQVRDKVEFAPIGRILPTSAPSYPYDVYANVLKGHEGSSESATSIPSRPTSPGPFRLKDAVTSGSMLSPRALPFSPRAGTGRGFIGFNDTSSSASVPAILNPAVPVSQLLGIAEEENEALLHQMMELPTRFAPACRLGTETWLFSLTAKFGQKASTFSSAASSVSGSSSTTPGKSGGGPNLSSSLPTALGGVTNQMDRFAKLIERLHSALRPFTQLPSPETGLTGPLLPQLPLTVHDLHRAVVSDYELDLLSEDANLFDFCDDDDIASRPFDVDSTRTFTSFSKFTFTNPNQYRSASAIVSQGLSRQPTSSSKLSGLKTGARPQPIPVTSQSLGPAVTAVPPYLFKRINRIEAALTIVLREAFSFIDQYDRATSGTTTKSGSIPAGRQAGAASTLGATDIGASAGLSRHSRIEKLAKMVAQTLLNRIRRIAVAILRRKEARMRLKMLMMRYYALLRSGYQESPVNSSMFASRPSEEGTNTSSQVVGAADDENPDNDVSLNDESSMNPPPQTTMVNSTSKVAPNTWATTNGSSPSSGERVVVLGGIGSLRNINRVSPSSLHDSDVHQTKSTTATRTVQDLNAFDLVHRAVGQLDTNPSLSLCKVAHLVSKPSRSSDTHQPSALETISALLKFKTYPKLYFRQNKTGKPSAYDISDTHSLAAPEVQIAVTRHSNSPLLSPKRLSLRSNPESQQSSSSQNAITDAPLLRRHPSYLSLDREETVSINNTLFAVNLVTSTSDRPTTERPGSLTSDPLIDSNHTSVTTRPPLVSVTYSLSPTYKTTSHFPRFGSSTLHARMTSSGPVSIDTSGLPVYISPPLPGHVSELNENLTGEYRNLTKHLSRTAGLRGCIPYAKMGARAPLSSTSASHSEGATPGTPSTPPLHDYHRPLLSTSSTFVSQLPSVTSSAEMLALSRYAYEQAYDVVSLLPQLSHALPYNVRNIILAGCTLPTSSHLSSTMLQPTNSVLTNISVTRNQASQVASMLNKVEQALANTSNLIQREVSSPPTEDSLSAPIPDYPRLIGKTSWFSPAVLPMLHAIASHIVSSLLNADLSKALSLSDGVPTSPRSTTEQEAQFPILTKALAEEPVATLAGPVSPHFVIAAAMTALQQLRTLATRALNAASTPASVEQAQQDVKLIDFAFHLFRFKGGFPSLFPSAPQSDASTLQGSFWNTWRILRMPSSLAYVIPVDFINKISCRLAPLKTITSPTMRYCWLLLNRSSPASIAPHSSSSRTRGAYPGEDEDAADTLSPLPNSTSLHTRPRPAPLQFKEKTSDDRVKQHLPSILASHYRSPKRSVLSNAIENINTNALLFSSYGVLVSKPSSLSTINSAITSSFHLPSSDPGQSISDLLSPAAVSSTMGLVNLGFPSPSPRIGSPDPDSDKWTFTLDSTPDTTASPSSSLSPLSSPRLISARVFSQPETHSMLVNMDKGVPFTFYPLYPITDNDIDILAASNLRHSLIARAHTTLQDVTDHPLRTQVSSLFTSPSSFTMSSLASLLPSTPMHFPEDTSLQSLVAALSRPILDQSATLESVARRPLDRTLQMLGSTIADGVLTAPERVLLQKILQDDQVSSTSTPSPSSLLTSASNGSPISEGDGLSASSIPFVGTLSAIPSLIEHPIAPFCVSPDLSSPFPLPSSSPSSSSYFSLDPLFLGLPVPTTATSSSRPASLSSDLLLNALSSTPRPDALDDVSHATPLNPISSWHDLVYNDSFPLYFKSLLPPLLKAMKHIHSLRQLPSERGSVSTTSSPAPLKRSLLPPTTSRLASVSVGGSDPPTMTSSAPAMLGTFPLVPRDSVYSLSNFDNTACLSSLGDEDIITFSDVVLTPTPFTSETGVEGSALGSGLNSNNTVIVGEGLNRANSNTPAPPNTNLLQGIDDNLVLNAVEILATKASGSFARTLGPATVRRISLMRRDLERFEKTKVRYDRAKLALQIEADARMLAASSTTTGLATGVAADTEKPEGSVDLRSIIAQSSENAVRQAESRLSWDAKRSNTTTTLGGETKVQEGPSASSKQGGHVYLENEPTFDFDEDVRKNVYYIYKNFEKPKRMAMIDVYLKHRSHKTRARVKQYFIDRMHWKKQQQRLQENAARQADAKEAVVSVVSGFVKTIVDCAVHGAVEKKVVFFEYDLADTDDYETRKAAVNDFNRRVRISSA